MRLDGATERGERCAARENGRQARQLLQCARWEEGEGAGGRARSISKKGGRGRWSGSRCLLGLKEKMGRDEVGGLLQLGLKKEKRS
jgi:hypothetical protein